MLIISFGHKYPGKDNQRYLIEGKYHIPIGYKCLIRWHEDEIVFMTREGIVGPEFEILLLPKSALKEDFRHFEANPNIEEIWKAFIEECQETEQDMSALEKGPWYVFGITNDTVQIAVTKNHDEKTVVDGILYCEDGKTSTKDEYAQYLGGQFGAGEPDEHYAWICHAFMDEKLPANVFAYQKNGMVYWVDAKTNQSTWQHPHLAKYRKMLHSGRVNRPLPHWKTVMAFQIEFLFENLFTYQHHATGVYPPVETIENTLEMARIFQVTKSLQTEPYYCHVLKRALRHYATIVKDKRAVTDVDDFRNLMQRYRDLVDDLKKAKVTEQKQCKSLMVCVECNKGEAKIYCNDCKDLFCQGCFERLHKRGKRSAHLRTWVELSSCTECDETLAQYFCPQCQDQFCVDCYAEFHMRGGRRNHVPIILRSHSSNQIAPPSTEPWNHGAIHPAQVAVQSGASANLQKALSHWHVFRDDSNINLYYNILTTETRRDKPSIVNEPLLENMGGGMAAGWSGTSSVAVQFAEGR